MTAMNFRPGQSRITSRMSTSELPFLLNLEPQWDIYYYSRSHLIENLKVHPGILEYHKEYVVENQDKKRACRNLFRNCYRLVQKNVIFCLTSKSAFTASLSSISIETWQRFLTLNRKYQYEHHSAKKCGTPKRSVHQLLTGHRACSWYRWSLPAPFRWASGTADPPWHHTPSPRIEKNWIE